MLISSVGTFYACGWTKHWRKEYAIALMELLVENATFYPAAWLCARLLPKPETKKQEAFEDLVAVEGLDIILRLSCFVLAQQFPDIKDWLTGIGSLLLDIVFLISISNSHRLAEILRHRRFELISWGIAQA